MFMKINTGYSISEKNWTKNSCKSVFTDELKRLLES